MTSLTLDDKNETKSLPAPVLSFLSACNSAVAAIPFDFLTIPSNPKLTFLPTHDGLCKHWLPVLLD